MLTCFNVQKTHNFSNTVHYCSSSMPRLSQTCSFPQSLSFQQVQSALIGQLTQCIVIGRAPQARIGNVTALTIIASFSFQGSFISSSPRGEQSRVTDTVMMLACICSTQAVVKGIVHFEIKIWYPSAYPKGIQDVGVFFSSVDPILMFLGQTVLVCQSYNGRYRSLSL